ncbi:hypothetical protein B0H14DRAFT_3452815 [Mycena olivaceomarginata]|nr:hypothetical protein B0H14DRAFT_3452815 [Mycena olivaceomarginata]
MSSEHAHASSPAFYSLPPSSTLYFMSSAIAPSLFASCFPSPPHSFPPSLPTLSSLPPPCALPPLPPALILRLPILHYTHCPCPSPLSLLPSASPSLARPHPALFSSPPSPPAPSLPSAPSLPLPLPLLPY